LKRVVSSPRSGKKRMYRRLGPDHCFERALLYSYLPFPTPLSPNSTLMLRSSDRVYHLRRNDKGKFLFGRGSSTSTNYVERPLVEKRVSVPMRTATMCAPANQSTAPMQRVQDAFKVLIRFVLLCRPCPLKRLCWYLPLNGSKERTPCRPIDVRSEPTSAAVGQMALVDALKRRKRKSQHTPVDPFA